MGLIKIAIEKYIKIYGKKFKENRIIMQKLDVENNSKVYIIGDIHSSLHSLFRIIKDFKENNIINDNFELIDKNNYIIFLGDIIGRGAYSIECLWLILKLFNANENNVRIINGNHEDSRSYEKCKDHKTDDCFKYEFDMQFNSEGYEKFKDVAEFFYYLPSVIFLKFGNDDKRFQLCHGGPIDINNKKKIKEVKDFLSNNDKYTISDEKEERNINYNEFKWGDIGWWVDEKKKKYIIDKDNYKLINFITKNHIDKEISENMSYRKFKLNRMTSNQNYIKIYNKYLNLHAIISGHQDLVNFGYVGLKIPKKPHSRYNEYGIDSCVYDEYLCEYELPNDDLLACVTSTALATKFKEESLDRDCYLILSKILETQYPQSREHYKLDE